MKNKERILQHNKSELNIEAMESGYIEMAMINYEIANEMYHLETESTYRIDSLLAKKGFTQINHM